MSDMASWVKFCTARIKHRDSVFESERMKAWHDRQNLVHRFANGVSVEIQLKPTTKKP